MERVTEEKKEEEPEGVYIFVTFSKRDIRREKRKGGSIETLAFDRSSSSRFLDRRAGRGEGWAERLARSESILSLTMDRILKPARPPVCHRILETAILPTWSHSSLAQRFNATNLI